MKFSDRLSKLRNENNLSRDDLAKKLGVSYSTVSKYETGTREPDFKSLEVISKLFGVTTDYLLGLTNDPSLTEKDEKDIAKRMHKMKKDLLQGNATNEGLNYLGEPMSEEAIESLLEALEHAERIATLTNKKFIPKKYRDKE